MARPASLHPTDGELEILHVLWADGPSALSAICDQLRAHREVATTTVATMLRIMLGKRLVARKGAGRAARWTAVVTHQAAAHGMVSKLVDHVFDGAADRLAAHLVEGGRLSEKQLAELRKLIGQQTKLKRAKKGARR
ncbi:MAG: BlaI/MecI/CopY family transcriptional regulator [Planctomycetes bacterium]|nr:BlaI/MecI/CopY family transcriptional regulator [Planctomycetota bacterium]